ncbi:hypothetical protein ONZ45_g11206 [Pleurotus djamor]|nr:hypothetical protein ONZ45_g11206 [Pleurotus djamor]
MTVQSVSSTNIALTYVRISLHRQNSLQSDAYDHETLDRTWLTVARRSERTNGDSTSTSKGLMVPLTLPKEPSDQPVSVAACSDLAANLFASGFFPIRRLIRIPGAYSSASA